MERAILAFCSTRRMVTPSRLTSSMVVKISFTSIEEVNREGVTILLVEQNAKMALSIASRAYVLETGNVVMEGEGKAMLRDDNVRKAYLGA